MIVLPEISATAPSANSSATGIAHARARGSRRTSTPATATAAASATVPSTKLATAVITGSNLARGGAAQPSSASAGCEPMM